MKAFIYARTAIKEHTYDNDLQAQVEACRQYAEENSFDVVRIFTDNGFSGVKLDRPALTQMRNQMAHETIAAVIVCDPARLTRSIEDRTLLEGEFRKRAITLHCVAQGAMKLNS